MEQLEQERFKLRSGRLRNQANYDSWKSKTSTSMPKIFNKIQQTLERWFALLLCFCTCRNMPVTGKCLLCFNHCLKSAKKIVQVGKKQKKEKKQYLKISFLQSFLKR